MTANPSTVPTARGVILYEVDKSSGCHQAKVFAHGRVRRGCCRALPRYDAARGREPQVLAADGGRRRRPVRGLRGRREHALQRRLARARLLAAARRLHPALDRRVLVDMALVLFESDVARLLVSLVVLAIAFSDWLWAWKDALGRRGRAC